VSSRLFSHEAVALLHNDVLLQYETWGLPVGAVLTDNGREFCGTETHVYGLYLALNDIEHRRTKVRYPQTNGFVERFNRTVLEEFFAITLREQFYEGLKRCKPPSMPGSFTTTANGRIAGIATSGGGRWTPSRSSFHLRDEGLSSTAS
jgi:transposase InsO family protein